MRDPDSFSLHVDVSLLDRYLAGEASKSERARIAQWTEASPEARLLIEELGTSGAFDDARSDGVIFDALAIRKTLGEAVSIANKATPLSRRATNTGFRMGRNVPPHRARAAWPLAIGALAAVLCAVWIVVGGAGRLGRDTRPQVRTYATTVGQRAQVTLDDGTRVILAPWTTLKVLDMHGDTRSVALDGEAYFEVAPGERSSFTVQTGHVVTRVLGTKFMVRHYVQDPDVLVAVRSGKVVTGHRTPVVLTNNMMARVTDSTEIVTAGTNLNEYMEWVNGRLVFTDVPSEEVTTVLGRWYGFTFRFADTAMRHLPVTGAFDYNDSREDMLKSLQLMLGAQLRFDGNRVTLIPVRHATAPRLQRTVPGEENARRRDVGR